MKKFAYRLFLSIVFMLTTLVFQAQCAMCKANAENASRENASVGEELNDGIIYLMLMPYMMLAVVVMIFYRKKIMAFIR
jgi:hypothetical protein